MVKVRKMYRPQRPLWAFTTISFIPQVTDVLHIMCMGPLRFLWGMALFLKKGFLLIHILIFKLKDLS